MKNFDMSSLPPDNLSRNMTLSDADSPTASHLSLVGNTYTVLLSGKDTAGHYCLIDMYIAPGGGPSLHRHNFEESFIVLEGEIKATFRGEATTVRAGQTIHIPANAPHQFKNETDRPARLFCLCAPSGEEEFFAQIGFPVPTRTAPPPPLDIAAQAALKAKAQQLAPKYKTELL